jgi:hypothetical protein
MIAEVFAFKGQMDIQTIVGNFRQVMRPNLRDR